MALFGAFFLLVVIVAVSANYGPLHHWVQAKGRLQEANTRVEALEQKTAALQSQLGKLTQTGYLEDLARKQFTYAKSGEKLYIVPDGTTAGQASSTSTAGQALNAGAALSLQGGVPQSSHATGAGSGASSDGSGGTVAPGFLERMLLGIARLF